MAVKKMDEYLQKLIAAEKEGQAMVDQARRHADQIAREAKEAIERGAQETRAFIDGLRAREERKLEAELNDARAASARRINAACEAIERKLASGKDRAVDAIQKELTR